MVSVALAAAAAAAALFFVAALVALLVVTRRANAAQPSTATQLRALQRASQEWSIPYHELRFGRLLGKGSQGEVFLGEWRGTAVAIKKVDTAKVKQETVEEFCQEAAIMRRLRHPCLTLFLGVSIQHPFLCIVTEFVERGSLFDLLRDETAPLSWKKCLGIAQDVAQGVQYLHAHSPPILHRDLKSLNILVDRHWRAKVADFGMTRFQAEGTMTQCGSPLWMAPEMVRNDPYDEKADVYSFGIVLWELYTHKVPYRGLGLNPNQLVVRVVKEDLRPVLPIRCPLAYVRLVESCWHPSAAKRPAFKAVVKKLEQLAADPAVLAHRPFGDAKEDAAPEAAPPPPPREEDEAQAVDEAAERAAARNWRIEQREVTLHERIAQGRSATVYRGSFRGKEVAVKQWTVNRAALASTAELDAKVEAIFDAVSQLRHPNLVLFMGAYLAPDHVAMVGEHMARGSVQALLEAPGAHVEWATAVQILLDAAQGMAYLHGRQPPILHGDLKASRLLLDANWRVKISGSGIVDFASTIQAVARSGWTAPEVLRSPANGLAASNVYSFGVIVWQLLTRSALPFGMPFNEQLARRVQAGLRPDIPAGVVPAFAELMARCWHAEPSKRPTFEAIVAALNKLKLDGPPKTLLSAATARVFRRRKTVFAFTSKDPVVISKDYGKLRGRAGCVVVYNGDDDVSLMAPEAFAAAYERVAGREHEFRKTGTVLARRLEQPAAVRTGDGVEGGRAGDWLLQSDAGDQWIVDARTFAALYEPAEPAPAPA